MPNKLKVMNEEVEFSETVKYLGITFDKGLNWNTHFRIQINKYKQYLFMPKTVLQKPGAKTYLHKMGI